MITALQDNLRIVDFEESIEREKRKWKKHVADSKFSEYIEKRKKKREQEKLILRTGFAICSSSILSVYLLSFSIYSWQIDTTGLEESNGDVIACLKGPIVA